MRSHVIMLMLIHNYIEKRHLLYPAGRCISFCVRILETWVSGIEILAIARAAGADMKDAEITCSAGT